MVQWRSISQEGIYVPRRELCGSMEEEVLEKYKVDGAKRVLIKDVVSCQIGGSSTRKRGINFGSGERIVGLEFSLIQRIDS